MNCRVCGCKLINDTYGSRCEDCWAIKQPTCDKVPVRSGRRLGRVDSEAQYDFGHKRWRWTDVWSRREDG